MTHTINRGKAKDGHPIARAEAFAHEEREKRIRKEKVAAPVEPQAKPKVKPAPKRTVKAKKKTRVVKKAK